MSRAAVILAAGASRRMGRPKALLDIGGQTFADRLIEILSAECHPVFVVLAHQAETVAAGLRRASQAIFILNPDPRRGQLSSLQCALRAVPPGTDAVMLSPVDCPSVAPATIAALAGALPDASGSARIAIPRYLGRRGHPLCVAGEFIPELLALPPEEETRELLRRHPDAIRYIDLEDPGILGDVDDPEAYGALLRSLPGS